jgi:myo-inositol-1(or 4)-monophosphatase
MHDEYAMIIDFVKKNGDAALAKSGQIADIGIKKQWLTEEDLRIERTFVELMKTFPGEHVVYGEEEHNDAKSGENIWVVDPISGTFTFIHGLPHFSVVISHIRNGETVFAAVYDPSMKELFSAEKGKGAFLNDKRIVVSEDTKDFVILYDPNPLIDYKKEKNLALLNELFPLGTVRSVGSFALNYAYVACGRAHIAISRNKDTFTEFAGKLLVEEAGGNFTDFSGGEITMTTRGIVAANKSLHKNILPIVVRYRKELD